MGDLKIDTAIAFEMASLGAGRSPSTRPESPSSKSGSMAALRAVDPQEGVAVQELPPVDGGLRAWTFCAAGFVLEMMVWGFAYRSAPALAACSASLLTRGFFAVMVSSKVRR